ncbi:AAA family ATPase [Planktothrix agardhii]|uniref:AAA family ATPase n=2 Tax=Planktothrix agardhii TaxID=1160 RepID=UPI00041AEA87|nr:AAA family ATPase [Planktothrix agardhii]CAD5952027.1 ATPase [Planktothrix agardhii]
MIKTFELVRALRLHTLQYYFNFIIFNSRLQFFELTDKIHNQTVYKNVHNQMLERVELHNFKSHRSTQLSLDGSRLHALVGQNSSGKTSVLQALHYLSRLGGDDYSSFANIFQYERHPEFLTTTGQNNMSVIGSGFWGYGIRRRNWEASYQWKQGVNHPWFPTALWKVDQTQGNVQGWDSSLSKSPEPIRKALRYSVHLKLVATSCSRKVNRRRDGTPAAMLGGDESGTSTRKRYSYRINRLYS